jgi:formate-dependent phosphoribosylglycinamide formyltransferase (GAR transformylase)
VFGVELFVKGDQVWFSEVSPRPHDTGMVTMVMVLQSVGLPAEAIAILLPIDRLLDTLRTTVNVEGDMVGSLVVQKLLAKQAA